MNAFDPTAVLSQNAPDLLAADRQRPGHIPSKPLTEAALCDWIAQALPGERIEYHRGLLLQDRSDANSPHPPKESQRVHAVAKRAWYASQVGLVHLVSQRVEPFVFRYFAVRARLTPDAAQARKQLRTQAH